jgi:hypothetical protein
VRRRCRYVIVSDASEDAGSTFSDLGNAIEKCRVDFGVDIEIDVAPLRRDPATGLSQAHCTVGRIRYDRADGNADVGTLIYLKPTLIGCEPVDVRTYAQANLNFPHQSTTDQWFDETQFESYRALGEHVAGAAFEFEAREFAEVPSTEALFTRLRQHHLAPAPGVEHSFSKHCAALCRLYEELRDNPKLAFLDAQFCPEWDLLRVQTLTSPDLKWRERESLLPPPNPEQMPTSERELRAGFYFCQELIQLMESVYTDLNLEHHHAHPDNRGWMNHFFHWTWSATFRMTWAVMGSTTGVRFQKFCEQHLALSLGIGGKRIDAIGIRHTPPVRLTQVPAAVAASELTLSPREEELIAMLSNRPATRARDPVWSCFIGELRVARRQGTRDVSVPVTLGLICDGTLVFLRTRDHQRRSGLARDIVINLGRLGLARDCRLISDPSLIESATPLEVRRYERLYGQLLQESAYAAKTAT